MPDQARIDRDTYRNPMRPARLGLMVVLLFAGTIAAWSAFAPLSDAAIAEGTLQVEGRRQSVQHPFGGVVRELMVGEGDRVTRGQTLAILSDSRPRAERDVLAEQRISLLARQARLLAEQRGSETIEPVAGLGTDGEAAIEGELPVLQARLRQHGAAVDSVRRKIDQLREQMSGAMSEVTGLERQAELTGEEVSAARTLLDKGLTPRPRVLELEREVSRQAAALSSKRSDIASLRQSVAEAESEIARLQQERAAAISQELAEVRAELAGLMPRIAAAEDALSRTSIVAPATGTIVGLSIFTEGGVVEPGARLMDIVPADQPFFAEVRLQLTDMHQIEAGQVAQIELLSFPRSRRPDLDGKVRTVSADRIVDERTGQGYYRLDVGFDTERLDAARVDLQAGMPVRVIMPTRARTLFDYLTSPLLDEVSTAFREH